MTEIHTTYLMTLSAELSDMQTIGATPNGHRRIALVGSGKFEGPKLRGTILPGGTDWLIVRPDGAQMIDVRLVLETDDRAAIGMTYRGVRHGPDEVMAKLSAGEPVDPSLYYFRVAITFETAAQKYDWLNRIVAVGTGRRLPEGPIYDIFEIL